MAAKLLHSLSLTDDNPDLQKQIGCMTGIFQLFDRQLVVTGGRRIGGGHNPKRLLPPDNSNVSLGRESDDGHLKSATTSKGKYPHKNIQEKQRVATESSSRASFSSSSRSSSFSSLDCNRPAQLEPSSFDRIIFPETPSLDPAMSLQNSSPRFSRQSLDLRDFVKDSMYREVQALSGKSKTMEEPADSVRYRDSSWPQSSISDGTRELSGLDLKKKKTPADIKESLRALNNKLQETTRHQSEPRGLMRSSSYNHSKDVSSFAVSKDAPRYSYDGRETNRVSFDVSDISKSTLKYRELLKHPLDSSESSVRNPNVDSKSNAFLKTMQKNLHDVEDKTRSTKQTHGGQARPTSVVAKLMGLEALPDSASSGNINPGSTRSYPEKDEVDGSRLFLKNVSHVVRLSSNSKNLWKEPSSPSWRNHDSSMKHIARIPVEPAPWKQNDASKSSSRQVPRSTRAQAKPATPYHSVYSEIEKRIKDLEFTESGKDLGALKQILDSMQSKGFLEPEKEIPVSTFIHRKDQERPLSGPAMDIKLANDRKLNPDHQVFGSTKRRDAHQRAYQSPIVIMKPAKLVEVHGSPSASVIPLEGLGLPNFQGSEFVDDGNRLSSDRTAKDVLSGYIQRDNVVNSTNMKNDRTLRSTRTSIISKPGAKDGNTRPGKSSESISPRLQHRKLDLDKRSRPPTPPDSRKPRRQLKQQAESNSPGGKRRLKYINLQQHEEIADEIDVEPTMLNSHENDISVQPNETHLWSSNDEVVANSLRSPSTRSYDDLVEKESARKLSEEESTEFGFVPPEHSSPVSVLDHVVYRDDSPSPVKFVTKTIIVDASMEQQRKSNAASENSMGSSIQRSPESASTFESNRKKLENIENLVQKLRRLNSTHDEAHTDYIACLCENTDPDHRYISEILLASGLLLRELANFQFHPSGHPINPELFLVLEQTKTSSLLQECGGEKTTQSKLHRKLIFDSVNEILARKLTLARSSPEPWSRRPVKFFEKTLHAQKLLRELCSEIEVLKTKNDKCSSDEAEDERWRKILCRDVMHESKSWTNVDEQISGAVLDIERSIFKDLVDEIVIGESSAGLNSTRGRRRRFSN